MEVRIGADATALATEIVKHTDTLAKQTAAHIEHSKTLTVQTDILVTESKKLGRLTWALIGLTVGLLILTAALLYIDWHREHEAKPPTTAYSK